MLFELVPKVSETADLIFEKMFEICADAVFIVPKAITAAAMISFNFIILIYVITFSNIFLHPERRDILKPLP